MKTEVYSWRLDADLKEELEAEARRRKKSVGALLDQYAREGIHKAHKRRFDESEEARIRARVEKAIGSVSLGLGPYTNERVHEAFAEAWAEKRDRNRPR